MLQRRLTFAIGQFSDSSTRLAHCAAWILGQYFGWLEISMALAVTGGTYVVLGDELTIMEYVIFIIMSREIFKPFFAAESYYLTYIMAKNSYERIQKIVNSPVLPDTGTTDFPKHYDIVFENVSFTYDREKQAKKTLAAINITVPEGMVTALVGPSGSGKTTLTNLLIRFYDPDTGIIKIGGINIKEIPYDTLLTHITVMMQEVFLFSGTIYENLLIGNQQATAEEVITAAQQAMIHDEIMALPHGYNTAISERGIGLSGGQRQRLAIARAFLKGADIIILDEATSNVDPVNEYRIQQAIANLAKNRTVIVIAHHLRTIKNADQIVVLKDGQVAEAGTHKSLLGKDSLYASLWNAQEARKIAG
ncbi:ABC transporter ATP-binding protein [Sporomusa ovata]|uniref:ABC transporter ATP-binding protein n=1 Tax=Sporomusa ovata TaxID=2378 RepID=UPI0012EE606E|nr:ATP-binding cassette domain-containing protein [Sporomusa ovata]